MSTSIWTTPDDGTYSRRRRTWQFSCQSGGAHIYAGEDLRQDSVRWNLHAWFEAIHPLIDGNGRVGRLLWWNMTMLVGAPIEVITFNERFAYYDRLEEWRKTNCNKYLLNPFE